MWNESCEGILIGSLTFDGFIDLICELLRMNALDIRIVRCLFGAC